MTQFTEAYMPPQASVNYMMTSSNGSLFRVTGSLCAEFPSQSSSKADFDVMWDYMTFIWRHHNAVWFVTVTGQRRVRMISNLHQGLGLRKLRSLISPFSNNADPSQRASKADFDVSLMWSWWGMIRRRNLTAQSTQDIYFTSGLGLRKLCSLISPLWKSSVWQKCMLDYLNHNHIWQVLPQLRCSNTWYQHDIQNT